MKRYQLLITSLLIGMLSGCSKFLETTPDMRTSVDSPEKVAELLTSAYPRANYAPFIEAMSDNADDKGAAAGGGVNINSDPWKFQDVQDRNQDTPDFYWNACYTAIAAANRAIAIIEAARDGLDYSAQKGEALVARAYAHFMLVTLFAHVYDPITAHSDPGIPYVTEPEEVVIKKYERKTVAYVYEQIEQDLATGLPLINDSKYKAPKFHFTKAAAHAFASRFYLFKRDYEKVVQHASMVFPSLGFYENLRVVNSTSFRAMEYYQKQAQYTLSTNPANILLVEVSSSWARSFSTYRYGLTTGLLGALFFSANVTGGQYAYMFYGGTELVYNIPKFREHFVRDGINANYGVPFNILPVLSAEEVLLNRAEAYAMLSNYNEAIADLNTFARAKIFVSQDIPEYIPDLHTITPTKLNTHYGGDNLSQQIVRAALDFKRREFVFEGLRYLDILRHNLPVTHISHDKKQTYFLGPNDLRRTLQLPQEVILAGIEANPR